MLSQLNGGKRVKKRTTKFFSLTSDMKLKTTHSIHKEYFEIIGFYFPLLLNMGALTLSTPFLNYGLGKAKDPIIALASFSASFSILLVLNSVIFSGRNLYNSLIKDKASFKKIFTFYLLISSIFSVLFLLIGGTFLGDIVFGNILQTTPGVTIHAKRFMLFSSPLPVLTAYKVSYQSISTVFKKPIFLTIGSTIRFVLIFLITLVSIIILPNEPGIAASMAFSISVSLETLFLFFATKKFRSFSISLKINNYSHNLTFKYIFSYFLPLFSSSLAWAISFPLINFFIGFTAHNKEGLAGFGVLRSLIIFMGAPLYIFATVILILGSKNDTIKLIKKFCFFITLFTTLVLSAVIFSNYKFVLLHDFYNLSDKTLLWTNESFSLLIFIPILISFYSYSQGIFLKEKKPNIIGITGIIRSLSIIISGTLFLVFFPNINGVLLGVWLMIIASLADAISMLSALLTLKLKVSKQSYEIIT